MTKSYNVAVIGATGAVGEAIIELLEARDFPVDKLYPLASRRSAGKTVVFKGHSIRVKALDDFDFTSVDIALFAAGGDVAKEYAQKAVAGGCLVIDNSEYFRADDTVPLVIPGVNSDALARAEAPRLVACPSSLTTILLIALKPLYDAFGLDRVNVCAYQSVSAQGKKGVEALAGQTAQLLNGLQPVSSVYQAQIAFNCLTPVGQLSEDGYTQEERALIIEPKKILADKQIRVNPTCVTAPVFYAHCQSVHIELSEPASAEQVKSLLQEAEGIKVFDSESMLCSEYGKSHELTEDEADTDDQEAGDESVECEEPEEHGRESSYSHPGFPTPVEESTGKNHIAVSRIREDLSHGRGINLWLVGDNIRKASALNSVQIAELLIKSQ